MFVSVFFFGTERKLCDRCLFQVAYFNSLVSFLLFLLFFFVIHITMLLIMWFPAFELRCGNNYVFIVLVIIIVMLLFGFILD